MLIMKIVSYLKTVLEILSKILLAGIQKANISKKKLNIC